MYTCSSPQMHARFAFSTARRIHRRPQRSDILSHPTQQIHAPPGTHLVDPCLPTGWNLWPDAAFFIVHCVQLRNLTFAALYMSAVPPGDGMHTVIVNGEEFTVSTRYRNLAYIARGAYGMVCTADDAVRARMLRSCVCSPASAGLACIKLHGGVSRLTACCAACRSQEPR